MNDVLVTCKEELDSEIEDIEGEDCEVEQYFSEDENLYRLSQIPDEIEIIPIMFNGECNGNSTVSFIIFQKSNFECWFHFVFFQASYQKYRFPQISSNYGTITCESCECYRKELKSLKQQLKDAEEKNKFLLSKLNTETNTTQIPEIKYKKLALSRQQKIEAPTPIVKSTGRGKRNLLSVQNYAKLNSISAGEKHDYIYVSCMLTMLWSKSELMCRSVTGKPSRNIMYGRVAKRPMTPQKVQLIKGKRLIYNLHCDNQI